MDVNIEKQGGGQFRATWWFWTVVLSFAGLWVLLPLLLHSGYKTDVIEMHLIGKEWVIATRKHPNLPVWILEILNILTNRHFAAPFVAASLCTIITLFSVWRLARKVLSEKSALIGTLTMMPFWSLTVESVRYNHNSTLMACWAMTTLMFYNAFQTNKKRWWIAAGFTLGIGFHAKYTIILLAVAVLLYSLGIPRFRRYWKESGPWLTIIISFAVFLPHLVWLYNAGFWTTSSYAFGVPQRHLTGIGAHFYYPIQWIVCQFVLVALSPLLLLIPSLGRKWKIRLLQSEVEKETLQYLFCCMAFPCLAFFLFAVLFGVNVPMAYGYTLWFFLGVYLLLRFQRQENADIVRQTFRWTSIAVFVMVIVFVIQSVGTAYLNGKPKRSFFPMRELGVECDLIWSSRFDLPCPYTSGLWTLAAYAAHTMKDRPSVHFYYDTIDDPQALPTGPWSTDGDVNQKGGIILWEAAPRARGQVFGGLLEREQALDIPVPDWVHDRFPNAEVLPEVLELPYKTGANIPPLRIGIALVPPPKNP